MLRTIYVTPTCSLVDEASRDSLANRSCALSSTSHSAQAIYIAPTPHLHLLPHCVQSPLSLISRGQAPLGHRPPNTQSTIDQTPSPPSPLFAYLLGHQQLVASAAWAKLLGQPNRGDWRNEYWIENFLAQKRRGKAENKFQIHCGTSHPWSPLAICSTGAEHLQRNWRRTWSLHQNQCTDLRSGEAAASYGPLLTRS